MKENVKNSIWFLITLSGIIYTIVIISCIQGAPMWGWITAIALLILQLAGLFYYMHRKPKKTEKGILKLFLVLLKLSAIGVIGWYCLAVYSLASQYHNQIDATVAKTAADNVTVIETDKLYIIEPCYNTIDFTTSRPYKSDKDIIFCSGATFQGSYSLMLDHAMLAANHVEKGKLYTGYEQQGLAAFTYYDGQYHFTPEEQADEEMMRAATRGGMGFRQFMIIQNGEIVMQPANEYRCYRLLAEQNGKLLIIDSKSQIKFAEFAQAAKNYGVENALYLDMGSGWNYSWYRNNDGQAITLIGLPWPFSHNWIVFKK